MKLGAFSVSLSVKDLTASIAFYEKPGFTRFHGNPEHKWVILKNGDAVIGLFQGMFENNIITFNPGWDQNASPVQPFDDVREIQKSLRSKGVTFITEADEQTNGPENLMLSDPDGNIILLDQHV